jgi:ATP-dependent exoDNAse (exonuclease V) alpha subunit
MATLSPHVLQLVAAAKLKHAALLASRQAEYNAAELATAARREAELKFAYKVDGPDWQNKVIKELASPGILSSTEQFAAVPSRTGAPAMVFDSTQLAAIELSLQAKSFNLIGAAGTGKTTTTQEIITRLQRASHVRPIAQATKHLVKDAPGIVICGYTNRAVNNIRKKLPAHLQPHCMTIHKLLEYAPVYFEVMDNESGQFKTTMRFEPSMNSYNPLPHISTLIFEESSMIGIDLYAEVIAALPRASQTQIIFLGDINQLKPVFGPSILGFKMAELQTV